MKHCEQNGRRHQRNELSKGVSHLPDQIDSLLTVETMRGFTENNLNSYCFIIKRENCKRFCFVIRCKYFCIPFTTPKR